MNYINALIESMLRAVRTMFAPRCSGPWGIVS